MNRSLCIFAAALLLSISSYAANKLAVKEQVLLKTSASWDGVTYQSYPAGPPELSVLKITIPAHTTLAWHTHPMPNAAYILSGQLTVEKKSNGETKVLHAGQVLPEMVGELHRGITGKEPAVLIVMYAGTKGLPLSEPEHKESK
jgi:quercetin dioxygenase-like cupin family protein